MLDIVDRHSRQAIRPESPAVASVATSPLAYILDDDSEVRTVVSLLLNSIGIETKLFSSAQELIDHGEPDRPCCLVSDVRLPGMSGLDLQIRLAEQGSLMPIIFVSGFADVPMSVQAMKAGAIDFLTKPWREQTILDAVERALSVSRAQHAERNYLQGLLTRLHKLTGRERDVLKGVATGQLNKQIAYDLQISEITVKVHRSRLMHKMGARSIAEIIRMIDKLGHEVVTRL
jgi:FixJ family two-component response regulator